MGAESSTPKKGLKFRLGRSIRLYMSADHNEIRFDEAGGVAEIETTRPARNPVTEPELELTHEVSTGLL